LRNSVVQLTTTLHRCNIVYLQHGGGPFGERIVADYGADCIAAVGSSMWMTGWSDSAAAPANPRPMCNQHVHVIVTCWNPAVR